MNPTSIPIGEETVSLRGGYQLRADDTQWCALRANGPGGQHVNKTSSAVELRFDVANSNLPDDAKQRLLGSADRRLSQSGVFVLKAQAFRSQALNRRDAMRRLLGWLEQALAPRRSRRPTAVPRAARKRRLDAKSRRGSLKRLRGRSSRQDPLD